jgi:hypothetical protein
MQLRLSACFAHPATLVWNGRQSLLFCYAVFLTDMGRRCRYSKRQVNLNAQWVFASDGGTGVGAGRLRPGAKGRSGPAGAGWAKRRSRIAGRNGSGRSARPARAFGAAGAAESDHSRDTIRLLGWILLGDVPRRRSSRQRLLWAIAKPCYVPRRTSGIVRY